MAVCLAAFLYAALSSPSPDTPGLIEALIVFLLITAAACGGLRLTDPYARPLCVLLLYGFSVPLLVGVLHGAGAGDMARDLVAFGALGLPLLLGGLFVNHGRMLLLILIGIGKAFAVRYLLMPDMVLASLASGPFDDHLLYLANSPLVFFAGLWLLLYGSFVETRWYYAILFILLSVLPIAAMAGMMQRATLALLLLAWLAGLIVTFIRSPGRAVILSIAAGGVLVMLWPLVDEVTQGLIQKT